MKLSKSNTPETEKSSQGNIIQLLFVWHGLPAFICCQVNETLCYILDEYRVKVRRIVDDDLRMERCFDFTGRVENSLFLRFNFFLSSFFKQNLSHPMNFFDQFS